MAIEAVEENALVDDAQRVEVEEQQLEVKGLLLAVEERVVVLQEEQGIL